MKNQRCLRTKKPPRWRLQLNWSECPLGGRKENARNSQNLAIERDAGVAVNPLKTSISQPLNLARAVVDGCPSK